MEETHRHGDDAGVGQEHDLERSAPGGGGESPSLPKGREVEQESDGGSGGSIGTQCAITQI